MLKKRKADHEVASVKKKQKTEVDATTKQVERPWEYRASVVDSAKSAELYADLVNLVKALPQKKVMVYGKLHDQRRVVGYFAAHEKTGGYSYSGSKQDNAGWPASLQWLAARAQEIVGTKEPFDAALVNWYRNGKDKVDKHRDKDAMQGTIVSFSFYETTDGSGDRDFLIRDNHGKIVHTQRLQNGSAFVMKPGMQQDYLHELPVRTRVKTGRMNVTLRQHQNHS